MQTLLRRLLLATVLVATPALATAQAPATKKIAPGTYQIVPDANFAAGIDVSGFTMRFDGDSVMVVEQAGAIMSRSRTSYEGQHLMWTDEGGELMCPGVAKYRLAFSDEGRTVRLTPVEDGCPERSAIITQISLKRKGN